METWLNYLIAFVNKQVFDWVEYERWEQIKMHLVKTVNEIHTFKYLDSDRTIEIPDNVKGIAFC